MHSSHRSFCVNDAERANEFTGRLVRVAGDERESNSACGGGGGADVCCRFFSNYEWKDGDQKFNESS